ncbi:MAG TPA: hypothetical protein VFW66_10340 [Gemmatimonadales bacterium]|nr:hypothetical protein [Gemmatimonadales bacterium]
MPTETIRRQARFLPDRVILSESVEHNRWYPIAQGRRHDDNRPGMVLLDLGVRRLNVPEVCLEFRDGRAGADMAADAPGPQRRARHWTRKLALTASIVPLGLVAALAAGLLVEGRPPQIR